MAKAHYVIPIFVPDLGCPHQCIFCNQKRITGQTEIPDALAVKKKIAEFLPYIPEGEDITVEVAFYGGSFTAVARELQKELLKPAFEALTGGQINHIRISTRPDAIDDETLATLSSYGVSIIELGVQSMDDNVLGMSHRGHTSRDVLRSVALVKSWGFTLGLQLMVGLPGDSRASSIATCEEIIALKPDFVRIYPCLVLQGTELAEKYGQGEYKPWSLEDAVDVCRDLLISFTRAGIQVIRIGLQPSEEISWSGDVMAGPYHPAFRELVESAVAREQIVQLLAKARNQVGAVKQAVFMVPETDQSIARGHKNSNIDFLRNQYSLEEIEFQTIPEAERGFILLVSANNHELNLASSRKSMDIH